MGTKRGQLTVFVIIGLLLLISVSLYFLLQSRTLPGVAPSILEAPVAIRPVVQFVTQCLTTQAKEGLIRIGAGGGYIDVRRSGASVNIAAPTEGDAVQFAPSSELAIPYWWYLKSPNDCRGACEFGTLKPPLLREGGVNSIEVQLDQYIQDTLNDCIGNFTQVEQEGFDVRAVGTPKATTTIGEEGVSFILDYPLLILRTGEEFRHESYRTHIEVPLTEMYRVGEELSQLEAKHRYLERHMQQVVDLYTGMAAGDLPPVAHATFDLSPGKRWVKEDVHRRVRELITAFVPLLQVWGTGNHVFLEAPADVSNRDRWVRIYNLNNLLTLEDNHLGLEVRFSAPDWWREHFDLNCRGQVCAPDSFINTFGFPFGFQKYNFAYDMSVPVIVEMRAPDAFGEEGYIFQYMLESNVRNNEPMPFVFEPWDTGANPVTQNSLLCDPEQRTGLGINVTVQDSVTDAYVDGALLYQCEDETCPVGETVGGAFTTRLPRCAGGTLKFIASERYSTSIPLNSLDEENISISLRSDPIVTLPVKVVRTRFVKIGGEWVFNPSPTRIKEGDQTVITFARNGDAVQEPYSAIAEVCGSEGPGEVRLIPGNYTVTLVTLYHRAIVFPPQRRCINDTLEETCYTIPDKQLTFGTGNARCDAPSPLLTGTTEVQWEVTPEMLRDAKGVVFKTLVAALDELTPQERVIEDLDIIGTIGDQPQAYAPYLRPTVVYG